MKTGSSKLPTLSGRHGFILLLLLLILVITGSSFVLAGLNNRQSSWLKQQTELHRQMEIAKANLLAYVANSATFFANARGPGFFPCPDIAHNTNGIISDSSAPSADCAAFLGRLPEYVDTGAQKFYLNNYYAGIDQQLWYAVGDRYTYSPNTSASNRRSFLRTSPTDGTAISKRFSLDGKSNYVALIIAPGEALNTQNRSGGGSTAYTNYLEGGNGNSNSGYSYYSEYGVNPVEFNDQVIGITLDEYVLAVGPRVATTMKVLLDAYHVPLNGDQYPDAAAFTTTMDSSGIQWLHSTVGNGEFWSKAATDVTYTRNSSNVTTLYFSDCAHITFRLTFGSGITRSGNSCS
jgi:hypothetical protein